jgi:hypothetical protein
MNPYCEIILWAALATCGRTEVTLVNPVSGHVHSVYAGDADWCSPTIDYLSRDDKGRELYRSWVRYDRDVFHALKPVKRVSHAESFKQNP